MAGITQNISSTGVLFTTYSGPDLGGPIEYIITLHQSSADPVNLRCMGKVVRAERMHSSELAETSAYRIAATLERYEFVRSQTHSVSA